MAFWGVEVKPGKPYTHVRDVAKGKLRLTQATLGNGTSSNRVIVQCNVGNKSPVLLCALLPEKTESLSLDLEFDEEEDVVLSVIGPRNIHLCGYFLGPCGRCDGDETDSYGEDIAASESDHSGNSDEYEEDFIDDGDLEMFPPSPKPNSGVVIEEITEHEEPPKGADGLRRLRKQHVVVSDDDDVGGPEHQIALKQVQTQLSESEDDDGFPISSSLKDKSDGRSTEGNYESEGKDTVDMEAVVQRETDKSSDKVDRKSKKRNKEQLKTEERPDVNCIPSEKGIGDEEMNVHQAQDEQLRKDGEPDKSEKSGKIGKNKKRKKKSGENVTSIPVLPGEKSIPNEIQSQSLDKHGGGKTINKEDAAVNSSMVPEDNGKSNRKIKKKRSKSELSQDGQKTDRENDQNEGDRNHNASKSEKKKKKSKSDAHAKIDGKIVEEVTGQVGEVKPYQTRSFSNGLIIEELAMGKPDGQRASSGKKVLVNYIGKLLNGQILDSNIGQRPFQFRLGVGEVVKGWDVGVNGMRIGDKRRLTIPPSMGYGSKSVGKIPANSTLVFDVELVAVK